MSFLRTIRTNIKDRKQIYKKRLNYFLSLTLACLIALIIYVLLTGKSPLSIIPSQQYKRPTYAFSIYGSGKMGDLSDPLGLAVSEEQERVYVTDSANHRIAVFSLEGKLLFTFSKVDKGELKNPVYIALDSNENIYVSDTIISKVCVFDKEGKFIKYFKTREKYNPLGLYIDKNDDLYIADKVGGRVLKLNNKGEKENEYGQFGKAKEADKELDMLYFPNNITVNDSKVYVTDSNNKRISVFDEDGNIDEVFSLGFTRGINFYESGDTKYFFTAKVFDHKILAVDNKGEILYSFGQAGAEDGSFSYPNDIQVLEERIYIVDTQNDRIQVWSF